MKDVIELGSHDMFLGEIVACTVDEQYLDKSGKLDLGKADLITFNHGDYYGLGKQLGHFGFSVKKKKRRKKNVRR